MADSLDQDRPFLLSRREAVRRTVLALGLAVSPRWLVAADGPEVASQVDAAPRYLSASQWAVAAAIADRILPRTSTPGARDVGVPAFIDRLYGEFMATDERDRFVAGLLAVNEAATRNRGTPFTSLASIDQDEVLREVARAEQSQPAGFFRDIRAATILGYFTSEPVGRTVLHYDPVPGRYDACVPLSDVGNVNWTT